MPLGFKPRKLYIINGHTMAVVLAERMKSCAQCNKGIKKLIGTSTVVQCRCTYYLRKK